MATIAYDLPVRDFIAALDATGHVSHTQHRKSKITFHHNGGRLSHEGVLSVWQVRPASAHFNFDAVGSCAQFVRIAEYAWATGSTLGNQQSISFEMANLTLGPQWNVAEITWRRAARLAGWIHARVFGWRPTSDSIVVHKYWSATTCAGPHIDSVYGQILAVAQQTYDDIVLGRVIRKKDSVVKLVKGNESPAHYVLEITGDGIRKSHISNEDILMIYRTMLGAPDDNGDFQLAEVEVKPQWMIDTVSNGPTL